MLLLLLLLLLLLMLLMLMVLIDGPLVGHALRRGSVAGGRTEKNKPF
jgi:multisubunit Na+/H+ antiporter MnhG subunit